MITLPKLDDFLNDLGCRIKMNNSNSDNIPNLFSYSKINCLGDEISYKVETIDDVNYLIYETTGLCIKWDFNNLSFFTYPEEDILRLGYWTDLNKMDRWVRGVANPGDDPLMVLDDIIYGFNNDL